MLMKTGRLGVKYQNHGDITEKVRGLLQQSVPTVKILVRESPKS